MEGWRKRKKKLRKDRGKEKGGEKGKDCGKCSGKHNREREKREPENVMEGDTGSRKEGEGREGERLG